MKQIVLLLTLILGLLCSYGQEREINPHELTPTLRDFVASPETKTELQAKANTYIRTTKGNMVYLWNKRNQWSPYYPPQNYLTIPTPYHLNDRQLLVRLYLKRLSPYFSGVNTLNERRSIVGSIHYIDSDGVIRETMMTIYAQKKVSIPIEVYERLEAEILEANIQAYYPYPRMLKLLKYVEDDYSIGVGDLANYSKASEAKYYTNDSIREVLSLNYHQIHHPQHQDIVFKIVQNAYKLLWDTATFAYFTPEIISRVIVDVEYPEYRRIQGGYEYRDGDIAALLLPFDQRTFKKDKLDKRVYDNKSALFQILFNPKRYEELSDLDFALAYTQKLVQAYLSYELIIDARIDPKVKDYLEKTNWFEGNFRQTLEYYAQLRGVALDTLKQKYVEEITSVLLPLDLCDEETLRFALREQLKE